MARTTHPDHWRAVLRAAGGPEVADADLLDRFRTGRDEAAFAELVARHGRLVYGVCRRVLADRHRAEDAYQAVWLVLARRAADVRPAARLPAWLHGVAVRTALRAKRADDRRRRYERAAPLPPTAAPPPDPDLGPVLDAELAALPERLRLPVLLCDLGGRPQREAARALGLPTATLANRLKAARDRLAARLTARGLAPAALVLTDPLPSVSASTSATRLAEDVLMGLALAKWKTAAVAGVVIGAVLLIGRAWGVSPLLAAPDEPPAKKQAADAPRSPEPPFLDRMIRDLRGDTPTLIERTYYRADPDPNRDWNAAVFACYDDPTVRARLDTKPGWPLSGFFVGEKDQPPHLTDRVRLIVVRVKAGVEPGKAKEDEMDTSQVFEWPVPPPRPVPPKPKPPARPARERDRTAPSHLPAYRIGELDELDITARVGDRTPLPGQPVNGKYSVGPNGSVTLGRWGEVKLDGLSLEQAKEAVRAQVAKTPAPDGTRLAADKLQVWVYAHTIFRSVRVVTDLPNETGVTELTYTGSNTVVDAVDAVGGNEWMDLRVWVERRGEAKGQRHQVLPVDWYGITRRGVTATNYVLRADDEVHVQALHPAREKELADAEQALRQAGPDSPLRPRLETAVAEARAAATRPPDEDDDDLFLRRLLLAVRGTPPTCLERSYFRQDDDPDKRNKVAGWLRAKPAPPRPTARERYTLLPPDSISITIRPVPGPATTTKLDGNYYANSPLQPDGSVKVGWEGMNPANVSGLTVDQAAEAIRRAVKNPADADRIRVEVKVDGYNNHRGFEIVQDGRVRKIAYRGETVFKQLMRDADGPADFDGKRIWIDRGGTVLPIDWDAITRRRDETTNHVIEPGDVLHVAGR